MSNSVMINNQMSDVADSEVASNEVFTDFNRLRRSVAGLICAKSYLGDENSIEVDNIIKLAEKIEISRYVQSSDFIAVAGMQGTGKTTVISCLYDLPRNLLSIGIGRSEQIPVFVSEDPSLSEGEYRAEQVFVDKDTGKPCRYELDVSSVATQSKKRESAFVELFVPSRYNAKFVLLPGFEKDEHKNFNEVYNSLMEYTLHFAKAVLLVVDDVGLANRDIVDLINMLGEKFSPSNCVFAISKCDLKTDPECEELKETLYNECREHDLKINKSQIVCTYGEKSNDWHNELFQCLENNIDYCASKKSYTYFRPMVNEMCKCAEKIKNAIGMEFAQIEFDDRPDVYNDLRSALEKTREKVKEDLEDKCIKAQVDIKDKFSGEFDNLGKSVKSDKKFFFIKKTEGEKKKDRETIRQIAEKLIFANGHDGPTLFIDKISKESVGMLRSESNNIEEQYLKTKGEMLKISQEGETDQLSSEDAYKLVAFYFDEKVPPLSDKITPNYSALANIVATEFKMYFYGAITNMQRNADVYHSYDTINSAMRKASRTKGKEWAAGAIALVDMLDGSPDIIKAVIEMGEETGISAALPYVGAAIAVASVAALGVRFYNDMIDAQNALCNSWVYSIQGAIEDQKEACLEVYDNASAKLLEHICNVHKQRKNVDEKRYRLANARYSIENIFKLAADIDKQYAMSILG